MCLENLSDDARKVIEMARELNFRVVKLRLVLGGVSLWVGNKRVFKSNSQDDIHRWYSVLDELTNHELIVLHEIRKNAHVYVLTDTIEGV